MFSCDLKTEVLLTLPMPDKVCCYKFRCQKYYTSRKIKRTRCSAIAERPRCRMRYSFRQK